MIGDNLVRSSLNRILNNAGYSTNAVSAFTDWPALESVTLRFINFVTPWLVVDGENLAENTLRDAITSYDATLPHGYEASHRIYMERLAASAKVLSSLRVSVKDRDGLWAVWTYDEPLMRHMANHKRNTIQIRRRETPMASGPVMIKLLAAISNTHELEIAGIDYPSLLSLDAA